MSIDSNVVKKIGRLARIKLTEEDIVNYEQDLNSILHWMGQLQEVDTENVKPLLSVIPHDITMRKDEVTDGNIQSAVLKNAPVNKYGCFIVPKVVE